MAEYNNFGTVSVMVTGRMKLSQLFRLLGERESNSRARARLLPDTVVECRLCSPCTVHVYTLLDARGKRTVIYVRQRRSRYVRVCASYVAYRESYPNVTTLINARAVLLQLSSE